MVLDLIRAELERLQLHSVNLSVAELDDQCVALRGSLLGYWKLPDRLPGPWLHERLQALPDAAGPVAVMEALLAACQPVLPRSTQLTLFEASAPTATAPTTAAREDFSNAKLS